MTLDEAIKHAEEVMVENMEKTKGRNASDPIAINCFECAEEHRQLAEWLRDYKRLKAQEPVLDKIRAEIEALPKTYPFINHIDTYVKEDDVKRIIDKYKTERSE